MTYDELRKASVASVCAYLGQGLPPLTESEAKSVAAESTARCALILSGMADRFSTVEESTLESRS